MIQPKFHPYIPIIIGVISVQLSAILVKLSNAKAGVITFYRMLFSVLLITPIFVFKYTKELKKLTKRDWVSSSFSGIFLAFHFILWIESLNYTSVKSSTVLVTLTIVCIYRNVFFLLRENNNERNPV